MLEIRYSGKNEAEIAGFKRELEDLRRAILEFIRGEAKEISFDVNRSIDPKPWDSVGQRLKISRGEPGARVSIPETGILMIEGTEENLDKFASFLVFDENLESGEHAPFEYYDGDTTIVQDSIPLVISAK